MDAGLQPLRQVSQASRPERWIPSENERDHEDALQTFGQSLTTLCEHAGGQFVGPDQRDAVALTGAFFMWRAFH